jgi:hypothetical protein
MFENYDELMYEVAQTLYDYMDEDFIEIVLEVERPSGDSIGFTGDYLNSEGEKKYLDFWEKDLEIGDTFHAIYQTMTAETDKHKWNRAKATLTDEMKLNIEYEWDQELADELERLSKEV